MEPRLKFEYDDEGDILYISTHAPYPEQETEELDYNLLVRRNPQSGVIEIVEVLFFTQWLLKERQPGVQVLRDLFREPRASTGT